MCVCAHACVCVSMCMCVYVRERERGGGGGANLFGVNEKESTNRTLTLKVSNVTTGRKRLVPRLKARRVFHRL